MRIDVRLEVAPGARSRGLVGRGQGPAGPRGDDRGALAAGKPAQVEDGLAVALPEAHARRAVHERAAGLGVEQALEDHAVGVGGEDLVQAERALVAARVEALFRLEVLADGVPEQVRVGLVVEREPAEGGLGGERLVGRRVGALIRDGAPGEAVGEDGVVDEVGRPVEVVLADGRRHAGVGPAAALDLVDAPGPVGELGRQALLDGLHDVGFRDDVGVGAELERVARVVGDVQPVDLGELHRRVLQLGHAERLEGAVGVFLIAEAAFLHDLQRAVGALAVRAVELAVLADEAVPAPAEQDPIGHVAVGRVAGADGLQGGDQPTQIERAPADAEARRLVGVVHHRGLFGVVGLIGQLALDERQAGQGGQGPRHVAVVGGRGDQAQAVGGEGGVERARLVPHGGRGVAVGGVAEPAGGLDVALEVGPGGLGDRALLGGHWADQRRAVGGGQLARRVAGRAGGGAERGNAVGGRALGGLLGGAGAALGEGPADGGVGGAMGAHAGRRGRLGGEGRRGHGHRQERGEGDGDHRAAAHWGLHVRIGPWAR
ncbi:hypothetical protein D3C72_406440 [compost metagenome]